MTSYNLQRNAIL